MYFYFHRRRRKASAAPAVAEVPRTTRRSARIHGAPPPEPDPQPELRGELPEEKPRVGEGSGARGAKKDPVVLGDLPQKTSEGQKLIQKSSAAQTVQQAKNKDEDYDHDEETPEPVVVTKALAVDTIEQRGTVRGPVNGGRSRGPPPSPRSKEPVARRTRGGRCRSSEDPTEPNTMDTENHDEDCRKAGHVQGEDMEPMVLKETAANMEDPSSPANIAVKTHRLTFHLWLLLSF